MPEERGVIKNREYATQIRDFSGMLWGNITPTDIDGLIEFHNICYVWIEIKYEKSELPFGQRLALERVCDDLDKIKPTIVIIASHNTSEDIDVASTIITEYRWKCKWKLTKNVTTTRQLADKFITWAKKEYMKQWDEVLQGVKQGE